MKRFITYDDFDSRKLIVNVMEPHGPNDLVLLDIMMPELDGQDVLKRIRNFEKSNKIYALERTKIVMGTCLGYTEHVIGSSKNGCDGYIRKPYSRESVILDHYRDHLI